MPSPAPLHLSESSEFKAQAVDWLSGAVQVRFFNPLLACHPADAPALSVSSLAG